MDVERRTVLQAGGLVAVGGLVVACGSSSSGAASSAPASSAAAPPSSAGGGSTAASGAGTVLTPTASVPVGGGVVLQDLSVVVTQPTSGAFKAFSAICTHQGCLVGSVENNEIICPCHGSKFSATDGSVVQGPATQPLAEGKITVSGGNVILSA